MKKLLLFILTLSVLFFIGLGNQGAKAQTTGTVIRAAVSTTSTYVVGDTLAKAIKIEQIVFSQASPVGSKALITIGGISYVLYEKGQSTPFVPFNYPRLSGFTLSVQGYKAAYQIMYFRLP
ncbi:MAG: hypothetical protein ACRC78_21675 [Planktothrix sp.]